MVSGGEVSGGEVSGGEWSCWWKSGSRDTDALRSQGTDG